MKKIVEVRKLDATAVCLLYSSGVWYTKGSEEDRKNLENFLKELESRENESVSLEEIKKIAEDLIAHSDLESFSEESKRQFFIENECTEFYDSRENKTELLLLLMDYIVNVCCSTLFVIKN